MNNLKIDQNDIASKYYNLKKFKYLENKKDCQGKIVKNE